MIETNRKLPTRSKHVPWVVMGLILLVMAATVAIITLNLRGGLRDQIIQQDGIMLYAASMVPSTIAEDMNLPEELAKDPEIKFMELTDKVFKAAEQKGVMAVRVFDSRGELVMGVGEDKPLSEWEMEKLRAFETTSSFETGGQNTEERGPLERMIAIFREVMSGRDEEKSVPLLRALVPLRQGDRFIGAAEYLLDGQNVAAELQQLDGNLWKYSIRIFLIGGGIMALSLWVAFGRLQRALGMLEERTQSLLRANHELTLAAKTSAVGAITAHLIHDLKSPLFGLQSFVSARGSADDEDWDIALSTTQRMQKMIQEIVRLLQEEKTTEKYELTVEEVLSLLREKLEPECAKMGIRFFTRGKMKGSMINRDGNIILLLITNLVHNAIQAVPKDGEIGVTVSEEDGQAVFEIHDTGPGLPEHILSTLFTPSRSTKSGGTGLGLAISKQLANHIGADLSLKETSKSGTVFQLRVPERMLNSELVGT